MAVVWVPPLLQGLTGGADRVTAPGRTLRQVLNSLEVRYPGIRDALLVGDGEEIQPGIAVVIDGEAGQMGLLEPVREDSEIHFIPAIAGG